MSSLFKAMASKLQGLASPMNSAGTAAAAAATPKPAHFDEIIEGSARVLTPKGAVFYNPAQVVNRDLSVLMLRHHARSSTKPLRILEALSATGLRSIRYYNEVPNVSYVIANDMDANAVAVVRESVRLNNLNPDTQVRPNEGDANIVMALSLQHAQMNNEKYAFDVIDLDPYGSAAPFLEPAIRSIADNGLLCVTCTDLPVLCGNSPEICYGRYAATPLKTPTTHEMAVRIVLQSAQATANRLGRAIEPVLCARIDFYVRLFLRVKDSKHLAQKTPANTAMVFQCTECGTQTLQHLGRMREISVGASSKRKRRRREQDTDVANGDAHAQSTTTEQQQEQQPNEKNSNTQGLLNEDKSQPVTTKSQTVYKFSPPLVSKHVHSQCHICGGQMAMGGPIWTGPLIEEGVAESLKKDLDAHPTSPLKARDRVQALVRLLDEEVRTVPLFMHLPSMCRTINSSVPPAASVRSVLTKKGYEVSQSHVDPGSLKTTAPPELVWDILRVWARKSGSSLLKKVDMLMKDDDDNHAHVGNGGATTKNQNDRNGHLENRHKNPTDRRLSTGERILSKEPILVTAEDIDFTVTKDKFVRRGTGDTKQIVRFPPNPTANWGPKPRAGGKRQRQDDNDEQRNGDGSG